MSADILQSTIIKTALNYLAIPKLAICNVVAVSKMAFSAKIINRISS